MNVYEVTVERVAGGYRYSHFSCTAEGTRPDVAIKKAYQMMRKAGKSFPKSGIVTYDREVAGIDLKTYCRYTELVGHPPVRNMKASDVREAIAHHMGDKLTGGKSDGPERLKKNFPL